MGHFAQMRKVCGKKQKSQFQDDASSNFAHNQVSKQYFEDDIGVSHFVFTLFSNSDFHINVCTFLSQSKCKIIPIGKPRKSEDLQSENLKI